MRRTLVPILSFVLVLSFAVFGFASEGMAQKSLVNFYADMDASQAVPPTGSSAVGKAEFVLDLTDRRITYRVLTTCVAPIPVLEIGIGDVGEVGTAIFQLNQGVYDMYEGKTPALTVAQVKALFEDGMWVAIASSFPFPGFVEIRGQLRPTVRRPFETDFSGGAVVPPTGSVATGRGWFRVNQPENTLSYDLELSGVEAIQVELRLGNVGENGPVIAALGANGDSFCGERALSNADLQSVLEQGTYVSISSASFPGGELRGQVVPAPDYYFVAPLTGDDAVPAVATSASGLGRFSLNSETNILSYDIEVSGMNATRLELGGGFPQQPTLQSARLPGGPTQWSGQVGPLNNSAIELLFRQGIHVRVKSADHPDGEIRGALRTNPYFYGFASDSSVGRLRSGHRNPHVAGNAGWTATLQGAPPGARVRLFVGDANESFRGSSIPYDLGTGIGPARSFLWMDPSNPRRFTATVGDDGCAAVTIPVPSSLGVVGYYQWVVFDGTTSSNLSVSDLMQVVIQ